MANWDTPKSTGEKIGKVIATKHNAIRVQLQPGITLHNGDGICFNVFCYNVQPGVVIDYATGSNWAA